MDLIFRGKSQSLWQPAHLEVAANEARKFLTDAQYDHAVQQVLSLCDEEDPTHPVLTDVDVIDEFHELRDKHGVLGKINLRIYFWVERKHKIIVVLGVCNKKVEGNTPTHIVKRHKRRKRHAEKLIEKHVAGEGTKVIADEKRKKS